MTEPAPLFPTPAAPVATGTVTAVDPRGPRVRSRELGEATARLALPDRGYAPRVGDEVLLVIDGAGQPYVVGVLRALREAEATPAIAAPGLEIAHDPARGATRVRVPAGDLELEATRGRVVLRGAAGVEIGSDRDVTVAARGRASLASVDADGTVHSGVRFEGAVGELKAGVLATRAAHLHTVAEEVTLAAARMDTHLERLRQRIEDFETEAGQIVETARTSYREVEGLSQTRAGRLRLVARSTFHALAQRAKLKAESIFAIDGESIHLG